MAILGWTVLFLVFVDELLAVAAAAVWGEHAIGAYAGGLVAGLLTVTVWFLFASPKARYGGPVVRPATKVVVFTLASVGLWAAGHHVLAVGLFAFSLVVNALAQLPSVKVLIRD